MYLRRNTCRIVAATKTFFENKFNSMAQSANTASVFEDEDAWREIEQLGLEDTMVMPYLAVFYFDFPGLKSSKKENIGLDLPPGVLAPHCHTPSSACLPATPVLVSITGSTAFSIRHLRSPALLLRAYKRFPSSLPRARVHYSRFRNIVHQKTVGCLFNLDEPKGAAPIPGTTQIRGSMSLCNDAVCFPRPFFHAEYQPRGDSIESKIAIRVAHRICRPSLQLHVPDGMRSPQGCDEPSRCVGPYIYTGYPIMTAYYTPHSNTRPAKSQKKAQQSSSSSGDIYMADPRDTDVVVPVLGQTGAGKSTFINNLLGEKAAPVNEGLDP
ncbi:hypothetical protein LshimejAT787_0702370 [Lyophyllum shimeji]|uniref:G domain-containing protein n=1 Tax=Lyophyllum shimeji TaxID=47721 RepID=A0A9P3PNL3_LYOSH|nr:hypothetical protein LshimejAT787_0702370 [Lyophyllum shimeji]